MKYSKLHLNSPSESPKKNLIKNSSKEKAINQHKLELYSSTLNDSRLGVHLKHIFQVYNCLGYIKKIHTQGFI